MVDIPFLLYVTGALITWVIEVYCKGYDAGRGEEVTFKEWWDAIGSCLVWPFFWFIVSTFILYDLGKEKARKKKEEGGT